MLPIVSFVFGYLVLTLQATGCAEGFGVRVGKGKRAQSKAKRILAIVVEVCGFLSIASISILASLSEFERW